MRKVELPVYNTSGQVVDQIELEESVFAVSFNEAVVHQALVRQRANARSGTADTKTRGEVSGSSRKLFRQKHTGLARAGTRRSPTRRHGGVAHGPHPRSFRQAMPRKMRRLALKCLLSAKAAEGVLLVLEELHFEEPSTRDLARILEALRLKSSVLIATAEPETNVHKSARSLVRVRVVPTAQLNAVDLLSHRTLVMTVGAVRRAQQIWGPQEMAEAAAS